MVKSKFAPMPADIIIPIMGITGVGKSTFINTVADEDDKKDKPIVGHGLESCTRRVQPFSFRYHANPNRRVVLVDTPGFNDTCKDNMKILSYVADWLERSYRTKQKLAGIIFLLEINQARNPSPKVIDMFEKLCGCAAARNVVLVTTKWNSVGIARDVGVGERHEQELSEDLLDSMLKQGSSMVRFQDTAESVWSIVDSIVEKGPVDGVQIQRELVDLKKSLVETKAGLVLGGKMNAPPVPWNTLINLLGRFFGR